MQCAAEAEVAERRQSGEMSGAERVFTGGTEVTGPVFDGPSLFLVDAETGDVSVMDSKADEPVAEVWASSGGAPAGCAVGSEGEVFIADPARAAVLRVGRDGKQEVLVDEYEGAPLKGPHGVAVGPDGTLYFTDAGAFGETSLSAPHGSLFCISSAHGGPLLLPLALQSLAGPAGVAVSADGKQLFVAERFANRVVRFVQKPEGVFHSSLYHQFSGRLGPSDVACGADGSLYVALYDVDGGSADGKVVRLNGEGEVDAEWRVDGPEVTGLALAPSGDRLYVTEATTKSVYAIRV